MKEKFFAKIWLVLLLAVFALTMPSLARMNFSRRMQGVDRKVTELMILSMQARDAGDIGNAELFWMHARELKPSLPKPPWLAAFSRENEIDEAAFLDRVSSLPYDQAIMLLEDRINKDPANRRLRGKMLELAEKNDDETKKKRHKSVLESQNQKPVAYVFRFVVFLIALVLLIWQIYEFVIELQKKRKSAADSNSADGALK